MLTNHTMIHRRVRQLNPNIEVRSAMISDAQHFTSLMNKQYSLRQKSEEYFYWQFIKTNRKTNLFVAYESETYVGCYGVQIHPLSNGVSCGFAVDLLVDDKYRNRGLFVLLEDEVCKYAFAEGSVAVTVLTNKLGKKAHTALGWQHIGTINTVLLSKYPENTVQIDLELGEPKLMVYFPKDKSYRHWRYDQNPQYKYDYLSLASGELAITKIFTDPVTHQRFGDIVDFDADLNNPEIMKNLFLKAIGHLQDQGVTEITTWALAHTPLRKVLGSLGFTEMAQERYFCVKVLDPEYTYLYDFANWQLVQADAEIY